MMDEDYEWFKSNYESFQKKYGDSFLAIKNKHVLGVYDSYAEGVLETMKKEELGTFIVQKCSRECEAYLCSISSMNFY